MLFHNVVYVIVKQPTYLSDHISQIIVWIKTSFYIDNQLPQNTTPLKSLPTQFIWDENSSEQFKDALSSHNCQLLTDEF